MFKESSIDKLFKLAVIVFHHVKDFVSRKEEITS